MLHTVPISAAPSGHYCTEQIQYTHSKQARKKTREENGNNDVGDAQKDMCWLYKNTSSAAVQKKWLHIDPLCSIRAWNYTSVLQVTVSL